ncbi:MAG: DUF6531 domain-containing protein, partial [Reinekea sp.]
MIQGILSKMKRLYMFHVLYFLVALLINSEVLAGSKVLADATYSASKLSPDLSEAIAGWNTTTKNNFDLCMAQEPSYRHRTCTMDITTLELSNNQPDNYSRTPGTSKINLKVERYFGVIETQVVTMIDDTLYNPIEIWWSCTEGRLVLEGSGNERKGYCVICDCDEEYTDGTCQPMNPSTSINYKDSLLYTFEVSNHDAERCSTPIPERDVTPTQCNNPDNTNANETTVGNPINCATGEKVQIETDYQGAGLDPLSFTRQYTSNIQDADKQPEWRVAYSAPSLSKKVFPDGAILYTFTNGGLRLIATQNNDPDGINTGTLIATQRFFFKPANGSGYSSSPYHDPISMTVEGQEVVYGGHTYRFNTDGSAATVSEKNQPELVRYRYTYTTINNTVVIAKVANRFGRWLDYQYDETGHLVSLTDQDGQVIHYRYDSLDNLTQVILPDNTPDDLADNPFKEYLFENSDFPNNLTGIVDEEGNRFATFAYNATGKAISTEHSNGAERVEVSYPKDGKAIVRFYRDVDSTAYREEEYQYAKFRGRYKLTSKTITHCDNCELTTET